MRSLLLAAIAATLCTVSGCGGGGARETTTATTVAFNPAGAPTVEFSVPDMMCEGSCVPEVRKVLAGQPGVVDVKVELATKTATVAVDKAKFDATAAVAALVDMQFKNTTLKSQ